MDAKNHDKPTLAELVGRLGSDDEARGMEAVAAIRHTKPEGAPAMLRPLLASHNPYERFRAALLLGELKDRQSVQGLCNLLTDHYHDVVRASAGSLAEIGDPAAVGPLARCLRHEGPSDSGTLTDSSHELPPVENDIAYALASFGKRAIDAFAETLRSGPPRARALAAWGLGAIGEPAAIEHLVRALEDEEPNVRHNAVRSLCDLGGREAATPIGRMLDDPDWWVRMRAAQALGRIGDPSSTEGLRAALADEHGTVREAARKALEQITGSSVAPAPDTD